MRVYTKTGDKGFTSLAGGERVPKIHARLEAYGTVDELNAFIGLLLEEITEFRDTEVLNNIQSLLFSVGGYLATPPAKAQQAQHFLFGAAESRMLEEEIDRMDALLPPLKSFVLPGGCKSAALSHVCRTITRRAERNIYKIDGFEEINPEILKFVNRLSDYFFVLARKECLSHEKEEKSWRSSCR
ncbi:MAG: cob(I)yrinic acid a,c-diamide adenosyltransferase [Dysgonamonadaceae bacterium]|jgi:cob(I)alamin adenosyltransferase|nr:cob(I)yrinic acid a,c-diamide adenosyltransferase [Dysgonamonadaceae bacterium]